MSISKLTSVLDFFYRVGLWIETSRAFDFLLFFSSFSLIFFLPFPILKTTLFHSWIKISIFNWLSLPSVTITTVGGRKTKNFQIFSLAYFDPSFQIQPPFLLKTSHLPWKSPKPNLIKFFFISHLHRWMMTKF